MSLLPVPLNVRAEHQAVLELPTDKPRATLPVPNPTQSFWLRDPGVQPAPAHGSTGELTSEADVCIIGSGITGVSAAYHLAKAVARAGEQGTSLSVVVLEARDFCSGATGRNGGHLTAHAYSDFRALKARYGTDEALRAIEIERYTVNEVYRILTEENKVEHVDFVPGGRVVLFFTAQEHQEARLDYEAAVAAGVDMQGVEWFTKEEVQKRYGASYPAVLIPGNNLWPLKLVSVLYNLAQNASDRFSLSLHTHTPVTVVSPLRTTSARRWQLATPRGPVACSYVLHATNGYAAHLLPWLHGPNGIVPTRGQVMATRASETFALGRTGFVGNQGFEYWFPRPNHTVSTTGDKGQLVILGGGREATRGRGYEFHTVDDATINSEINTVLRRFLPAVFPDKFKVSTEPEMEWTGIMGYTKTKDPFVGPLIDPSDPGSEVQYQGQYISAGYTGHGMPRGFACAEAVAGMIYADVSGKTWTEPKWLPLHYLTHQNVTKDNVL
ncbi:hypothetical protein PHLGIDRAFT_112157 [Phlebiopsis gigantea 11061_1 CR5-6]|uniref:FAD dependent oxidoreductase domain-containing protein n=1 Tax=Phlebiopsis gigantea (strain 11061_1 CR5-6) TaxID=745531 RepID=A0A0C3RQY4_PHLG1|nr:hypothetical protein PHLGIDRAFT_112157 [Phlebiopsis gigantea 11061_1 CR5-6]